jgi:superfamily II DNA/RNA helicase
MNKPFQTILNRKALLGCVQMGTGKTAAFDIQKKIDILVATP